MELKKKTFVKQPKKLPTSLDDALDILLDFYKSSLDEIRGMNEEEFEGSVHNGAGRFIRNEWYLWWFPNHENYKDWPEEQPPLNKWFESIGIVHADDMSGIILSCLYRKVHNLPFDIEEHVKFYHEHWKRQGYEDGIPKR